MAIVILLLFGKTFKKKIVLDIPFVLRKVHQNSIKNLKIKMFLHNIQIISQHIKGFLIIFYFHSWSTNLIGLFILVGVPNIYLVVKFY